MELSSIYEPIREGLAEVEENLAATAKVDSPFLARLLKHVLQNGGKRIRPALTLLAGKFYKFDLKLLVSMATAVELLHTATLVHDDTVDKSLTRRGKPTVNSLWGGAKAVLLGDYLFAKAASFAASTENIRAIKVFAQTLTTISSGELRETVATFNVKQMREHYYQWIGAKTACLFAAAAESGAIVSQSPEEAISALRDYGYNLGMAFQLIDDILDFTGKEAEMGKPVGADLSQGTLTLPAILFLERYPGDSLVKDAVNKKDAKSLKLVIERIREPSILKECFDIASDFRNRAVKSLERLPGSGPHKALIALVDYSLQRKM